MLDQFIKHFQPILAKHRENQGESMKEDLEHAFQEYMKRFLESDDADLEKQRKLALLERLKEPESDFDATLGFKDYVE
jgi:RNA polymerase-binding transcription factor DksA